MQTFTIHAAKTNLSKLIDAALSGEEVVVAIPQGKFKIGILKGKGLGSGPNFLEPLEESELAQWEGGK